MTTTVSPPRVPSDPAVRKTQRPKKAVGIRYGLMERLAPYGYVAPFFALFLVFGLFPLLFTFVVALFDWNPVGSQTFIGLDNFTRLFDDPRFWNAAGNTLSIWLISTIPQLFIALLLAHLLNHARLKWANFFRMSMLLPYITSVAATTIVFAQIFDRDYGLLNHLLELLGADRFDFRNSVLGSHVLIATMVVWRWFGYTTLLYLASLQAIPRDVYEAAAVDGASGWKQFVHITIPSLRPVIIFTIVTSTIGGLQIFTEPLLLSPQGQFSCGAVRQCQTLTLFLYEQGFGQFAFGYGSAVGVVLFGMIVVIALINFLLSTRIKGAQ
ncbi:carbohydrate ABC transporter permease [Planctomonas psychrotolerans]|uniref:carbohydrate ABC transporter permease n=1 Tax=Planctomonas psychrotolerans TaxID=2528712 RepID=UPI001D0D574C|nr:sugar ABC transporter permease [Planctomonas psychrotolerans]